MTGNDKPTETVLEDEAPDLVTPFWEERFTKSKVRRGRSKAAVTKVSATMRLAPDVVERFKADGPRRQARINEAVRLW